MNSKFKADKAIIMAAGKGNRLKPVTNEIPKPLIPVNGRRMIDTVIQGLMANGITDIYVVVGYLKEEFEVLKEDYPDIHLVENPYYESCNNISSLYAARDHLADCMILDGDQIIYDQEALSPYFDISGYNAVWTDSWTDEWLMDVKDGLVRSCSRNGGAHGWQLFSISRWNEADGRKLRRFIETEFEQKKNRQIYWDDVAMFCYPEQFRLGIHKMHKGDVVEIDSLAELAAIDSSYSIYLQNNVEETENDK